MRFVSIRIAYFTVDVVVIIQYHIKFYKRVFFYFLHWIFSPAKTAHYLCTRSIIIVRRFIYTDISDILPFGLVVSITRSIFSRLVPRHFVSITRVIERVSIIPFSQIAASVILDDYTDFHDIIRVISAYTSYLIGHCTRFPGLKRACHRNSRPSYAIVGICCDVPKTM